VKEMEEEERRELVMNFERNRQMLANIMQQKQQYTIQVEVIGASLDELKDTKEKTVMKIVGNIMVSKTVVEMKKELEEQKASFDLRLKTLVKQEETTMNKLNSIKAKLEGKTEEKEKKPAKKSKK
jgi:prefoldin beta subunit